MFSERALIVRIIPYSDSAVVLKCLTSEHGLVPIFTRLARKKQSAGHLQTGSFIECIADERPGKLLTMKESRLDANLAAMPLKPQHQATWFFTLELLHNCLHDHQQVPELRRRIDEYYAHLLHDSIESAPIIPLIVVSHCLGLSDIRSIPFRAGSPAQQALIRLGYEARINDHGVTDDEVFEKELHKLWDQFQIFQFKSLDLF